jgi:hypothetical protein
MKTKTNSILVGCGVLTWCRTERISDRYGTVWLMESDSGEPSEIVCPKGRGKLFALVIEARKSGHIGDILRGLYPSKPTNGDRFELGEGTAFLQKMDGVICVGVKPGDRENDWLNPECLYRCHNSLVELHWEPSA